MFRILQVNVKDIIFWKSKKLFSYDASSNAFKSPDSQALIALPVELKLLILCVTYTSQMLKWELFKNKQFIITFFCLTFVLTYAVSVAWNAQCQKIPSICLLGKSAVHHQYEVQCLPCPLPSGVQHPPSGVHQPRHQHQITDHIPWGTLCQRRFLQSEDHHALLTAVIPQMMTWSRVVAQFWARSPHQPTLGDTVQGVQEAPSEIIANSPMCELMYGHIFLKWKYGNGIWKSFYMNCIYRSVGII